MSKVFFITGTDTDVGKTFSANVLENQLVKKGFKVIPYKPIVAGFTNGHNADLDGHIKACNLQREPFDITTYSYLEPIAPHIAAKKNNNPINLIKLSQKLTELKAEKPDYIIIEGAGGWLLPINEKQTLADWEDLKDIGIIIVVGMKLGCLNHALLTAESILSKGYKLEGFIAKQLSAESMLYQEENLDTLKQVMPCKFICEIPYIESGDYRDIDIEVDL
ncbi:MAG: dethiobiotin synthase [Succinivibrionaceae bacterium]